MVGMLLYHGISTVKSEFASLAEVGDTLIHMIRLDACQSSVVIGFCQVAITFYCFGVVFDCLVKFILSHVKVASVEINISIFR